MKAGELPRAAAQELRRSSLRTVVIGAGHAGAQVVASLRQEGYEGEIVLIGEEAQLPYHRPPLSKAYLSGEQPLERLLIRPARFYEDKQIEVRTETRVTRIDREHRTVELDNGEVIDWTHLVIATGSRVRHLPIPGVDLGGVHYLRNIADVDAIRRDLDSARHMVIIGGGYIGLEVASVAVKAGKQVTVLEMEDRILQRVTRPSMSTYYTQVHTSAGVEIRCNAAASELLGDDRVRAVRCADGTEIPADLVIVGVGILPETGLAEAAGLECDNGILVDEQCRTSDPDIYAIGDCTNHPSALLGRRLRLESVPNATDQGRVAAANICGKVKSYDAVPWFWSDQYDLKLQMVGFSHDADTEVVRGDPETASFARFYLRDGVVIAVDAVNSARDFMAAKQLVASRKKVDPEKLADPEVAIKELL